MTELRPRAGEGDEAPADVAGGATTGGATAASDPTATTATADVPAAQRRGWPWEWTPGRVGLAVYLVVLITYCVVKGIPFDRIGQTGWIVAGILAAKIGRPWQEHVRTLLSWLPLLAALVMYDFTRGIADNLDRPVLVGELADAEAWLFGGTTPTVWLQEHLYLPTIQWWDVLASVVYFTHFVVPWALAAVLYVRSRTLWAPYIRRVLLLSYAGLITYILLPAAPPWYAAYFGEISEPVSRIATRGWELLGLRGAGAWFSEAQADVNQVAALPSLHSAFALLVTVSLWPFVHHVVLRTVLVLFPLAMAFTLVYGGEHYVIDVLAGWFYVVVVLIVARAWERWRARREGPPAPAEPDPLAEPASRA